MPAGNSNAHYNNVPISGLIADIDPEWPWRRVVVRGYVFSNGRPFYQREAPGEAYPWNEGNVGGNGLYHAP